MNEENLQQTLSQIDSSDGPTSVLRVGEEKISTGRRVGYFFLSLVPPILCLILQVAALLVVLIKTCIRHYKRRTGYFQPTDLCAGLHGFGFKLYLTWRFYLPYHRHFCIWTVVLSEFSQTPSNNGCNYSQNNASGNFSCSPLWRCIVLFFQWNHHCREHSFPEVS